MPFMGFVTALNIRLLKGDVVLSVASQLGLLG